jgi:hypothetical protein
MWLDRQIQNRDKWFRGSEFQSDGDTFIGYKAPARFCELAIDYPEIIESRMNGRFRECKIKLDDIGNRSVCLPSSMRNIVLSRLIKK